VRCTNQQTAFAGRGQNGLFVLSAAIIGFRRGFHYDRIAAISDKTNRCRGLRLGLLHALGHAAMIAVLGGAVIVFQFPLPRGIDRIAERLVVLTFLLLWGLRSGIAFSKETRPRSRFHVTAGALRWTPWERKMVLARSRCRALGGKELELYSKSVLMLGVVHGLGTEKPRQLMTFLHAAKPGGIGKGFVGLAMFFAGLLAMNTVITASAVGLFGFRSRLPRFQFVVAALTAIYSLAVGAFFVGTATTLG
jgi:high-affinity nickel-transport protein